MKISKELLHTLKIIMPIPCKMDFPSRTIRLCVPSGFVRELLVREVHGGSLGGHFGINKTIKIFKEHFYEP